MKALLIALTLATAVQAAPPPQAEAAERMLRDLKHRFVQALAGGQAAFMAELTAEDFRQLDERGRRVDRAGFLAGFEHAALTGVSHDPVQLRLFGNVALLHGVIESPQLRLRYTDVFHWDGSAWRLVAAQHTPLRAGVAKTLQRGTLPAHEAWRGEPLTDLHALNEAYVQAFRAADVGWYAAHLASDHVVTNSDGSFADRAAALTAFARPVFATQFKSYPVEQVRIRRFGDMALIEAQNPWETKDGRRGISRYTDIWLWRDGRWQCISAHLTPVQEP